MKITIVFNNFNLSRGLVEAWGMSTTEAIRATAFSLDESGVELVAPSHCTGDAAMEYFRQYFGERFWFGGLGATFEL